MLESSGQLRLTTTTILAFDRDLFRFHLLLEAASPQFEVVEDAASLCSWTPRGIREPRLRQMRKVGGADSTEIRVRLSTGMRGGGAHSSGERLR